MINFFGANSVVPNGYIYTSKKGSEYIFLEGFWFNHLNFKMIDPNKTTKMNEAAVKQILEHNSTEKRMIGESFKFAGKECVYVGRNKFTEDGVINESSIISEVIADEQRTYDVSRETLDKEWNVLKFFILPPHVEDVSIPAGIVVDGYRFVPRNSRFVNVQDGSTADNMLTRKLWAKANGLVHSSQHGDKLIPINSTIMVRDSNKRGVWNGTDFCDNNGDVIVPADDSKRIHAQYTQFVNANPQEFPDISGQAGEKEIRPAGKIIASGPKSFSIPSATSKREPVREAVSPKDITNFEPGDKDNISIPNGFKVGEFRYNKEKKAWHDSRGYADKKMANELYSDAHEQIKEFNKSDPYPVGSTMDYKGSKAIWNGTDWVSDKFGNLGDDGYYAVENFLESNPNAINGSDKSTTDDISTNSNGELVKGKTHITDKHGKVFVYQGGNVFKSSDGSTIPEETASKYIERIKSGEVTHSDGDGNEMDKPQSKQPNKSAPHEVEIPSGAVPETTVPDGYTITSKAGVRYFKKAGQWISSQTKKAMNSSAAKSIERAAEAKIDNFNKTAPVKVGEKWTSDKGKEYTYVGDDRFISPNGKLVPTNSAKQILSKMASNHKLDTDSAEDPKDETTQTSDPEVQATQQQEVPKSDNSSTGKGEASGVEGLAQKIKSTGPAVARKIKVLLTRGDKVSLLAADLLLSGKDKDAIAILKALNSSDE